MNKLVLLALAGTALLSLAAVAAEEAGNQADSRALREAEPGQAAEKKDNHATTTKKKEKKGKQVKGGKSAKAKKGKSDKKKGKSDKKKAKGGKKKGKNDKKKGKGDKKKGKGGKKKGKSDKKKGKSDKKKGKSDKKKGKSGKKKGNSEKKKGKSGKKTKSLARQSCTFDSYCLVSAAKYLRQITTKVNSFNLQSGRISKYSKMISTKGGKFGDFNPVQAKVKDAGGNNISDLRCQNVSNSPGTTALRATYTFLANCSQLINASCITPPVNNTVLTACTGYMNNFTSAVNNCTQLNGTAACTCWNSTTLANLSALVATCDIAATSTNVTTFKSKCLAQYGACRNNASASTDVIRTCNQANSNAVMLVQIQSATANADALTSLQTAVNKTISGTGRRRKARQTLSCADFLAAVQEVSSSAVNAPGQSNISTKASNAAANAPASCPDQATLLSASTSQLSTAVTAVKSLITTLQNNLQLLTGTTASPSQIASATPIPERTTTQRVTTKRTTTPRQTTAKRTTASRAARTTRVKTTRRVATRGPRTTRAKTTKKTIRKTTAKKTTAAKGLLKRVLTSLF